MTLRSVKIQNFRNLNGSYSLSPTINIIIAPNGAGKTNFLEAASFLSRGKSFKTNNESLTICRDINDKAPFRFARLEGKIQDALGNAFLKEVVLEKRNVGSLRKSLKVDSLRKAQSKFDDIFQSVVFSPNTIDLVISSPSRRRKDLDDFLSVIDDDYYEEAIEYRKVIRQRNKVLEKLQQNQGNDKELNFWNEKMILLGASIIYNREVFLRQIEPDIDELSKQLFNSNGGDLKISYQSKFLDELDEQAIRESLQKKLSQNYQKEIWAGRTLYGPQREDYNFLIGGFDAKEMGSRGQQRLCAFIYKISQKRQLKEKTQVEPVFLLDDLFSELDRNVRKKAMRYILEHEGQTILTALSKEEVTSDFLGSCNIVEL